MYSLFSNCRNLTSIDLSKFNTSKVTVMRDMFYNCVSLKSINFSELFNIYNVKTMKSMFSYCTNLTSLDLSFFDVSLVTDISYMFKNCDNLKYLNLPNFYPLNISSINQMFYGCSSLSYFNLKSFKINNLPNKEDILDKYIKHLKICIDDSVTRNHLFDSYYNKSQISYFCDNDNNTKYLTTTQYEEYSESIIYIENISEKTEYIKESSILIEEKNESYYNTIMNILINEYNRTNIDNGFDDVNMKDNIRYTITTTKNQKNNKNNNYTNIDLGDCE